jgi:protein-tyrosine phosphatase
MRILFACMGNICRSPVVAAVARKRFAEAGIAVEVGSAGTESYHVGRPADPRSIASAAAHGYDLSAHRGRQVRKSDFADFDWILAMDRINLRALAALCPREHADKVGLFLRQSGVSTPWEVPDPYSGPPAAFERVLELAEIGVAGLIEKLG